MLMTVIAGTQLAYASHFRYGHYTWKPTSGNTIEFTIQNAFRRDGYICTNPATLTFVPCTGPGGLAGVGDVFLETIGGTVFNPGDGSPTIGSPLGPLLYRVTSIDPANNWLFALALDPASLPAVKTTITTPTLLRATSSHLPTVAAASLLSLPTQCPHQQPGRWLSSGDAGKCGHWQQFTCERFAAHRGVPDQRFVFLLTGSRPQW